jgi:hypothetical protein
VANISGGDPAVTPKFNWVVKGSSIQSGQGESSMTAEPRAEGGEVSATVEVKGYDGSCSITANCTTRVIADTSPRKIEEYGDLSADEEKARLGSLAAELQNDPSARAYVICYGGRRSPAGEARRRCERARDYLGRTREHLSVVTVDGGFREEPTVELWVAPLGVASPQASPTVDPKDVTPPPPPPRKTPPRTPPRRPAKKPSDRVVPL